MTSAGRTAIWVGCGVIWPIAAFVVDASVNMDPVLWGRGGPFGGGVTRALGPQQLAVWFLAACGCAGTLLHIFDRPGQRRDVLAPALSLAGVVVALWHLPTFLPLVPLFAFGILLGGLGLLGFAPFAALLAWSWVLADALRRRLYRTRGSILAVLAPMLLGLLLAAVPIYPVYRLEQALAGMRGGDARAIAAGFRRLGALRPWARADLADIYIDLEAQAQVRLRNLYLEAYGCDIHDDLAWRR